MVEFLLPGMDIVSHGLWGGVAFGRKSKKSWLLAFLFGILPDFLAFGYHFGKIFLGFAPWPQFSIEQPDPTIIPSYIYSIYQVSHSLIVFGLLFALLWVLFGRPIYEFSVWGFHILVDIFTHNSGFFPTPFLWPLSNFYVNGLPWLDPRVLIPNVILLVIFYLIFLWSKSSTFLRGIQKVLDRRKKQNTS